MKNLGIYVHIPFCKKKCDYCDFVSFEAENNVQEKYVDALCMDIKNSAIKFQEYEINTMYFGGGTPSYISENLIVKILKEIQKNYKIANNAEITIEVNPGTVNKEKLEIYRKSGFNRISIGLQSTHDRLLKLIGRIHTYNEFLETYKSAREVGFENINVDLMFALPDETEESIAIQVSEVINLNPEHISIYSLILEEGTKMYDMVNTQKCILPKEDEEREMYWTVKNLLEKNGYNHYEISNFAKTPEYYSRHNLNYWSEGEYFGFGISASGFLNGA